jgi:hypothetical protein
MATSRVSGNLIVTGDFQATTMTVPSASVGDGQVKANAAIATTKLQHLHKAKYEEEIATLATAGVNTLFVASGTATINSVTFGCYAVPTGGDKTVVFDLKKNGTTILSATITFSSSDTDRVTKTGSLSSTSLVADDWLTVDISLTGTTGTQAKGVYCHVQVDEAAN